MVTAALLMAGAGSRIAKGTNQMKGACLRSVQSGERLSAFGVGRPADLACAAGLPTLGMAGGGRAGAPGSRSVAPLSRYVQILLEVNV